MYFLKCLELKNSGRSLIDTMYMYKKTQIVKERKKKLTAAATYLQ